MITFTRTVAPSYWISGQVRVQVIARFNPNEEQDPWVEFENMTTGQRYTCRQEAFEARYQPIFNH